MSFREILFRIRQKIQTEFEKIFLKHYRIHPTFPNGQLTKTTIHIPKLNPGQILETVDLLCNNKIDIFSLKECYIGESIQYHKDYKSGKLAPANVFGKGIDIRDKETIGDIKYIWELNRHLFMLPLALAYIATGEAKYLEKFKSFLSSWLEQNPFLYGVNWESSLEVGIRLINWTLCWQLLKDEIDDKLATQWLTSCYQHCWFISKNFSAFSSANNHLIGEASGLFVACAGLPEFDKSKKWKKISRKILLRECEKQNYSDGVNKEQAIGYQQFVLDFFILSGFFANRINADFPDTFWLRIEKMMEFLSALEAVNGYVPQIGDQDDGFVIDLGQRAIGVYRSLLNSAAYIFNRKDFLKDSRTIENDLKTRILLSIASVDYTRLPEKEKLVSQHFEQGGYYILGADLNTSDEQKLIFDCGPLGYLSIAAHGHADALSFIFSVGGKAVFIDPGTYSYHNQKKWRNYFRSTAAHNTLTVDGLDQSVITGDFMWSKKAQANIIAYEQNKLVRGTHDGYQRLNDPVAHIREISYNADERIWNVNDEIVCDKEHTIALHFHCAPECTVKRKENEIHISFDEKTCILYFQEDMQVTIHHGDDIPLGWYSPAYDFKIPTTTIKLSKTINKNYNIISKFKVV